MDIDFIEPLKMLSEGTEISEGLSEAGLYSELRVSRFVPLNNTSLYKSYLNCLGFSVSVCKPRRPNSSQILCWT